MLAFLQALEGFAREGVMPEFVQRALSHRYRDKRMVSGEVMSFPRRSSESNDWRRV